MRNKYDYQEFLRVKKVFFTNGEIEFFRRLLTLPKERNIHFMLRELGSEFLFDNAMQLIDNVEFGIVTEEKMPFVEYKIAHYLAAINETQSDYEKMKTFDDEERIKLAEKRKRNEKSAVNKVMSEAQQKREHEYIKYLMELSFKALREQQEKIDKAEEESFDKI